MDTVSMQGGAMFDATGQYRYHLWRTWEDGLPRVAFILLNPSTADATRDDPTVRRCIGFARTWGYGGLDIVNLFAYRATSPAVLRRVPDPVGPDNDLYILDIAQRANLVVAAWGNGGRRLGRDAVVIKLLPAICLACLGTTQWRQPRHPLYVRSDMAWRLLSRPDERKMTTDSEDGSDHCVIHPLFSPNPLSWSA